MITIEEKIPIPKKKYRKQKYPFSEMKKGDSFQVIGAPKTTVLNAANQWASRHNPKAKFTIRHEDGKTRIWRTR